MNGLWPRLTLFALGAYHGINPGMGGLFAVALGMQEKARRAVLAAIPPVALGHAMSVAVVVGLLWLAQASLPENVMRYTATAVLFSFGLYRLLRSRHPKWVGMRVGFKELTLWSFLMASTHGAGLMLVPIKIGWHRAEYGGHAEHASHGDHLQTPALTSPLWWLLAVVVRGAGRLLVAGLIAALVYGKFGLALLGRA
jgi:hypothetical protein